MRTNRGRSYDKRQGFIDSCRTMKPESAKGFGLQRAASTDHSKPTVAVFDQPSYWCVVAGVIGKWSDYLLPFAHVNCLPKFYKLD